MAPFFWSVKELPLILSNLQAHISGLHCKLAAVNKINDHLYPVSQHMLLKKASYFPLQDSAARGPCGDEKLLSSINFYLLHVDY